MPNPDFTVRVNDTEGEITSTLKYASGAIVNLTGATVRFRMRPIEGGALKVDAVATVTGLATEGNVLYQWLAADTNTAGLYVAEWRVTFADTGIESFPNDEVMYVLVTEGLSTAASRDYVTLPELKDVLQITEPNLDSQLQAAITAASRVIDAKTGRVFYAHSGAATARKFTPETTTHALVDDFYELTSVVSYGTTWTLDTYFAAMPRSGPPWDTLRALSSYAFAPFYPLSLVVTAKWGYSAVPSEIRMATKILAARLYRRPAEAPFGVAGFGIDGASVYVSKYDPEIDLLLMPYRRVLAA